MEDLFSQDTRPTGPDDAQEVRLCQLLLGRGIVGAEDLEACRRERREALAGGEAPPPLVQVLLRRGLVNAARLGEVLRDAAGPPDPGGRLGRYRLVREIARGGMGVVHEAWDPSLKRAVALKVLLAPSPELVQRLQREAALAARLAHPGIVTVHEIGVASDGKDELHFIAMEYVEGHTLAEEIERGDRDRCLDLLEQAARAVGFAHQNGVTHRDLKPANVLVSRDGRALVTDFGLARGRLDTQLTASGALLGTPSYMSPEQVLGRVDRIGPASDVWSLGVILYLTLVRRAPFEGESPAEVHAAILGREPPRPRRLVPDVPPDLETVCRVALEKEPWRRYPDALAFAADLARARMGEPLSARPPSVLGRLSRWVRRRPAPVLAFALALALAGGGAAWLRSRARSERRVARLEHATRRLESERAEATKGRSLQAALREAAGRLADARAFFYIREVDIRAKLAEVERVLDGLERLTRDPEHAREADLWTTLGGGWYLVGRAGRARAALEAAIERRPADGWAWFWLARLETDRLLEDLFLPPDERDRRRDEWRGRIVAHLARIERWSGARELDRHLARAISALAAGKPDAVTLCQSGTERYRGELGGEEFWLLLSAMRPREGALAALDQALRRRPHYPWARLLRAASHLSAGQTQDALADVESALVASPWFGRAWHLRGQVRMAAGQHREAEADYTRALQLDPGDSAALYNRALARFRLADLAGARADLDRSHRLDPGRMMTLVNRGTVRDRLGDAEGALADYDLALRLDPRAVLAWFNRGRVRQSRGDLAGAIADYGRALELDPRHARAWANRGSAHHRQGDADRALADYAQAIQLDPRDALSLANRGALRLRLGDPAGALEDLDRAVALEPRSGAFAFDRGRAHHARGDWEKAEADYSRAVAAEPGRMAVWLNRGSVRAVRGNLGGAESDLTRALELAPGNADCLRQRAAVRLARRDHRGALADLDAAIAADPSSAGAYHNRALARSALGDGAGALADLERAIGLAPQQAMSRLERARLLLTRGDAAGAARDLERAVANAPRSWSAWADYGRALARLPGRKKEAADAFRRAASLAPADERARLAEELAKVESGGD